MSDSYNDSKPRFNTTDKVAGIMLAAGLYGTGWGQDAINNLQTPASIIASAVPVNGPVSSATVAPGNSPVTTATGSADVAALQEQSTLQQAVQAAADTRQQKETERNGTAIIASLGAMGLGLRSLQRKNNDKDAKHAEAVRAERKAAVGPSSQARG